MKNFIKISRNFTTKFCFKNNAEQQSISDIVSKNTENKKSEDVIKQNNYKMSKEAKERVNKEKINEMLEYLEAPNLKELPSNFEKIPASLFLKLSAENLKTLFIENGKINFRGNLKAKREIGLTDLFPKLSEKQQFLVIDGETYAYGARRHDGKIGYGNPKYKAITGGENIESFVSSDEKTSQFFGESQDNSSFANYAEFTKNFAGFDLENLTPDEEKKEKESFIKETEYVEEVESKYRELIDFPEEIPAISIDQMKSAAAKLGINYAAIKAIMSVESNGISGATRFEPHIYKKYKNIPLSLEKKGLTQMATSFGAFQIMGFNYESAGFESVEDMVDAMKTPEGQINAFVNFVENNSGIHTALKNQDWQAFAKLYNGPDYKKNNYDSKISTEFYKNLITG